MTFVSDIPLIFYLAGSDLVHTDQSSLKPYALVIFVKYGCKNKKEQLFLIKPFPYNHSISDISAGLDYDTQRDFTKVKTKIINLNEKLTRVLLKLVTRENRRFL